MLSIRKENEIERFYEKRLRDFCDEDFSPKLRFRIPKRQYSQGYD